MKNVVILSEAPEMLSNLGVSISNTTVNKDTAKDMLSNPSRYDLEQDDETLLFRVGNDKHYKIALYNKEEKTIDYYVECQVHGTLGSDYVTQVLVWRRSDSFHVQGITKRMFLDYLLSDHRQIMSDDMQTSAGREFWIRVMTICAKHGLRVGLADIAAKTVKWYNKAQDGVFGDWLRANNGWMDSDRGQELRYVIHA